MRLVGRLSLFLAMLATIGPATTARADDRVEAREHYKKGTKAFELGAYDEAIAEYSAAYRLRDDPALLYNLAQSHRLANHPTEALRLYRMFLLKTPNAANRAEVEAKIADLQKVSEQQKATANPAAESAKPPQPATTEAPIPNPSPTTSPATGPSSPAPSSVSDATTQRFARTKKIAGIALAAGGLAVVVGGIVCGVLAQQAGDNLTKLDQNRQKFDYNQQQTGITDQTLEAVLLGVGGAAIVSGTVLYFVGRHQQKAARVSFAPHLGHTTVGATMVGTF